MTNKYLRTIYGVDKAGNVVSVQVDIYSVLDAFQTKNPALDHLVKKALCPGQRGHKDLLTDLDDIIASAKRAKELVVNRMACTTEAVSEDTPENMQMRENAFLGERRTDTFEPVSITAEVPERGYKTAFETRPASFTGACIYVVGGADRGAIEQLECEAANCDTVIEYVRAELGCPVGAIVIHDNGKKMPQDGPNWHYSIGQGVRILLNDQTKETTNA